MTGAGRDLDYGHRILPDIRWIKLDLNELGDANAWNAHLSGVDCVINASGLLQSGDGGSLKRVQHDSIVALARACEASGVKRFIQISAAGADADSPNAFMATKGRADAELAQSGLDFLILRPGLVVGRNSYGGIELIRMAAAVPAIAIDPGFDRPIQCVALSDLVDAVLIGLTGPSRSVDLVEESPHTLFEIICAHRRWLGLPEPRWSVAVPYWLVRILNTAADLLGALGWRSPLRSNAIQSLEAGVVGDSHQARDFLQREPLSLETTLARQPSGKQDRLHARVGLVLPLIIAALFIMWAASGATTLFQLDRAASILMHGGVGKGAAFATAIGGGWLDVVLAVGLLWRRTIRAALLAMIILTVFVYLVGGTVLLPGLWADPLAPFAKAIPATVLALIAYWLVEKR